MSHDFQDTYPTRPGRYCCDGKCEQGRFCPARNAAHASTEIGTEDDPAFHYAETVKDVLVFAVVMAVGAVVLFGAARWL